jgi:hypothetical protein
MGNRSVAESCSVNAIASARAVAVREKHRTEVTEATEGGIGSVAESCSVNAIASARAVAVRENPWPMRPDALEVWFSQRKFFFKPATNFRTAESYNSTLPATPRNSASWMKPVSALAGRTARSGICFDGENGRRSGADQIRSQELQEPNKD